MRKTEERQVFKNKILKILRLLKQEQITVAAPIIPIYNQANFIGYLRVVSQSAYDDRGEIRLLAKWRYASQAWFPAQFTVTEEGTRDWVQKKLIDAEDRILFFIETPSGKPIGHVGLFRFNFSEFACEIDNVIRGEAYLPGIMTSAIITLINWAKKYLKVKNIYLEVFSDNSRALKLYQRCDFIEIKRVPLRKEEQDGRVSWIEDVGKKRNIQRYNVYMKYRK
ncbi:MAG: hypothetical protein A3H17_01220 [Candidatus Levybacteria bacterium RIFCSPLOWO2_12_FULL_37_14]|nr:MAG: hypothetical protein A3H17_01220 [Candidatus Levybacteria bacterium RIFCSPLOWO2_12_FULL_37_14]